MKSKNWFEVSKDGLKELQAGKPKHFILRELIQNAWDEDIKHCNVFLNYDKNEAQILVSDDNPEGFKDLADAFTLFKSTAKRSNPEQRGRFNIGEKQAISICERAKITTTKGTIVFDKEGRRRTREQTKEGSEITLWVKMTREEYDEIFEMLYKYLPPKNIIFKINEITLCYKEPFKIVETSLETEILKEEIIQKSWRKTQIHVLERKSEESWLYELGLPICPIDCKYSLDIQQKIPLNIDRETVPEKYLNYLFTQVLNETYEDLTEDEVSNVWVRRASENKEIKTEALKKVIEERFGDKVCVANPFDENSIDEAISRGYNVIRGSELSKKEWDNIRENSILSSSTELFGGTFVQADYVKPSAQQLKVAKLAIKIAKKFLKTNIKVVFVNTDKANIIAQFETTTNTLMFNLHNLSATFFETPVSKDTLSLIIHELGHIGGHHIEMSYHELITKLSGELIMTALEESSFFDLSK
jgi:hypothetical protein